MTLGQVPSGRTAADTGAVAGGAGDVSEAVLVGGDLSDDDGSVVSSVWDRDDSDTASVSSLDSDYSDQDHPATGTDVPDTGPQTTVPVAKDVPGSLEEPAPALSRTDLVSSDVPAPDTAVLSPAPVRGAEAAAGVSRAGGATVDGLAPSQAVAEPEHGSPSAVSGPGNPVMDGDVPGLPVRDDARDVTVTPDGAGDVRPPRDDVRDTVPVDTGRSVDARLAEEGGRRGALSPEAGADERVATPVTLGHAAPGTPAPQTVSAPPAAVVPGAPSVVRLTGEIPDDELLSSPVPGRDGAERGGGRAWFVGEDMALRRPHYAHASAVEHWAVFDPKLNAEGPLERLEGRAAYTAALHVGPDGAELPLRDGRTGIINGYGLGGLLRRRPSLVRLGPHAEVRLLACGAGAQPQGDALERVPFGQDVATANRHVTHTGTAELALMGPSAGRPSRVVAIDDLSAPTHRQVTFYPEPERGELEALARRTGLVPGADRAAERALRWIRAIRREAGADLGWNPAREAEFETLMRGAMAWENTRLYDTADSVTDTGPLTERSLDRLLDRHRATRPGATLTHVLTHAPTQTTPVTDTRTPAGARATASPLTARTADHDLAARPQEAGIRQTAGAGGAAGSGRGGKASPLADPRQYNSGFGGTGLSIPSRGAAVTVSNPAAPTDIPAPSGDVTPDHASPDESGSDSDDSSRTEPDTGSVHPPSSATASRTGTAWIDREPLPGPDARAVHGVPVPALPGERGRSASEEPATSALRQYAETAATGTLTAEPESLLDQQARADPTSPPARPLALEADLAERRPPRVDRSLPPSTGRDTATAYTDGGRTPFRPEGIPADLPGLPSSVREWSAAPGAVTLRGIGLMVDRIAADLDSLPAGRPRRDGSSDPAGSPRAHLHADLRSAMLDNPGSFFGDGREFPYTDDTGEHRTLRVRARGYGHWERFSDPSAGTPVVRGTVSEVATGRVHRESTTYWVDPALPLWPAKKLLSVFFRISARFGVGRAVAYTLRDHAKSETTSVLPGNSHLHLDDVRLEYTVVTPGRARETSGPPTESAAAAPTVAPAPRTDAATEFGETVTPGAPTDGDRPAWSGFGVRSGLAVRLPESATRAAGPGRIPRAFEFDPSKAYRTVSVEDHGPVDHVRDWAAAQVGAEPGSELRRHIDAYFSTDTFHRMARRAAAGRAVSPVFFADDRGRTPLGVFTTRVTSRRALLLGESPDAETKEKSTAEHSNARMRVKTLGQDFAVGLGPTWDLPLAHGTSVRVNAGPRATYGHTQVRSTATGGTAGSHAIAALKKGPTGLYLVEKEVTVRRAGRDRRQAGSPEFPERTFTTWTLERLSRAEARRLAGWDDGTAVRERTGAGEPYAPAYLTEDHPPTLGMSRVEGFTFADGSERDRTGRTVLEDFTDRLLEGIARTYPGLVAPLSELDPDNPRWRSRSHYNKALANTLEVTGTLGQPGMAQLVETLTGGGIRIRLRDTRRGHRGYRFVWLDGELTGRRYEGTEGGGKRIASGSESEERLFGEDNTIHRLDGGIEGGVLGRGREIDSSGGRRGVGGFNLGVTAGRQRHQGVTSGPSAKTEQRTSGSRAPHLYSYHLAVTVSRGGYWRLPGLLRGVLSFGLLGTQPFVFRDGPAPLTPHTERTGATAAADGDRLMGRVLLSVGDEHTPGTDPHAPDANNPYRTTAARPTADPMEPARARALALATPQALAEAVDPPARLFEGHPVSTLSLSTPPELATVVEEVLDEASGGSWHATQEGSPVHDAATRSMQALALRATVDWSGDPLGRPTAGLWAPGPYTNRDGRLGHRLTLHAPRALASPVLMTTEDVLGHGSQVAGMIGRTRTFTVGAGASGATNYEPGSGVLSSYGVVANLWAHLRTDQTAQIVSTEHKVARKYSGHLVPVTADAEHEIAAVSSALGTLSLAGRRAVPGALAGVSGRQLRVPGGWLGHLTQSSAVELGVIADGLGSAPHYDRRGWSPAPWLAHSLVGGYPVGTLNTARALVEFLAELRATFDLDDSSYDTVLRMVSARTTQVMRGELTGGGTGITARTAGRWGVARFRIGGRQVRLRVALVPREGRYRGAGHGMTLKDELGGAKTMLTLATRTEGPDFGVVTTQLGQVSDDHARLTGPTYSGMGSARRTTGRIEPVTEQRGGELELEGPHAEYSTPYDLRIELTMHGAPEDEPAGGSSPTGRIAAVFDELRGLRRIGTQTDVGELREQIPLALMVPDPADATAAAPGIREDDPLGPVTLGGSTPPRPFAQASPEDWRAVRHPDGRIEPFTLPEGFLIRGVVGAEQVHTASVLSVAGAYGVGLPEGEPLDRLLERAQDTGLTRVATRSANALEDATTRTMLSGFFPHALTPGGHALPPLSQDNVVGGADGLLVLRVKPHLTGATLLTVADGAAQLSTLVAVRESGALSADTDAHIPGLTHNTVLLASENAVVVPGAPGAGRADATTEALGQTVETVGIGGPDGDARVLPGRHFVFAVPATWLSTARVHRHIRDSVPARMLFRSPDHGEQSYETDGHIIAWVHEDTARELGLIDDTVFPEVVAKAWDAVKQATGAWEKADERYWEKRRELGSRLHDELTRARERHEAALTAARAELEILRRAAEDLAEETHRVRAGADRLTRWYQLHATEEGRERLGELPEPEAVAFRRPETAPEEKPTEHPVYTSGPAADGALVLTAPDGTAYTPVDVLRDGDSFHHALAEGLRRAAPGAPTVLGIDLGGEPAAVARALRELLAGRLGDPDNADLLDALTPDETDTFSRDELAAADVDLGADDTPHSREFEALGVIPHAAPLTAGRRLALARAQLLRAGDAERDTGWDHGAADLLPPLAARTFGVRLTVVRGDGRFHDFPPAAPRPGLTPMPAPAPVSAPDPGDERPAGPDPAGGTAPAPVSAPGSGAVTGTGGRTAVPAPAPALVLHLDDRHYRLAVPTAGPDGRAVAAPDASRPSAAGGAPRPEGARTPPVRPAHATAPWKAPEAEPDVPRFDATRDARTLTGPDQRVYDLVESEGDGNRFYAALAEALRDTAGPARRPEPGRLRDAVVAQPLPDSGPTRPEDRDEETLREALRTAIRWDRTTADLAAELAANAHDLRLILIREEGTFTIHPAAGRDTTSQRSRERPTVILYERGGEYVMARLHEDLRHPERGRMPRFDRRLVDSGRGLAGGNRDAVPSGSGAGAPSGGALTDAVSTRLIDDQRMVRDAVNRPVLGAAVAEGLRLAAPHVLRRGPDDLASLFLGADLGSAPEPLYGWAGDEVTEADLETAGVPVPDRILSPADLESLGIPSTDARYVQAALNGGIPSSEAGLTRLAQFRLWCLRPGDRPAEVDAIVAEVVGRRLGIRFLLVTDAERGERRPFGDRASAITVLLMPEGDGYRVTEYVDPHG
ncbi:hypothetical protein ABZY42_34630 [Streptomyces sp. NPDC006622]|uniref:hypothetical protein n=1 Tax=Streptomyces sp. NPDC006622 TaxID=3155459 RepID=UPI0033BAFFC1